MTASGKATLAANLVAIAAVSSALLGASWTPPFPYPVHKALHLAGVVLLMGNLSVGPGWLSYAWYRDRPSLPFAVRALVAMDLWFTAPGIVLTMINGLWLASQWGGIGGTPWLASSVWALACAWALVPPALYWQERVASTAPEGGPAFERALVWWSVWGTLAMVPMMAAFWWMIAKPV